MNERRERNTNTGEITYGGISYEAGFSDRGAGFADMFSKLTAKLTGKIASKLASKAAEKLVEKGAEKIGEKTGQLVGEKIYYKFTAKKPAMQSESETKGKDIGEILRNQTPTPQSQSQPAKKNPANDNYQYVRDVYNALI